MDKNIAIAGRIAEGVAAAGGKTYYVGGCVRDRLMGRENKDIDIEVHGIPVKALEAILDGLGQRTVMGASFGVMGLRHYDIDIAMPRSERATGRGHKDFEVFVDPFIGEEKAALRRDFTMNALMQHVLTGEILDFFGGQRDIAAGRIRHVNDVTFPEDPLRVFRAAQFAARFDFQVAEETARLCGSMAVDALPPERVMGELEKALLKSARPSVFFVELRRMGQLSPWFSEMDALAPAAWADTMTALDAAAALKPRARQPLDLMLAAAFSGLSEADAHRAISRLTQEVQATRYVLSMAEQLGALADALRADPGEVGWMALFDGSVCPEDLILLAQACRVGPPEARLRTLYALYRDRMEKPFAMGRDLIEAGVTPGPRMGEALKYAHRLRLAGASKAEQLSGTLDWLREEGTAHD